MEEAKAGNYGKAFEHIDKCIDIISRLIEAGNKDLEDLLAQITKDYRPALLKQYEKYDPKGYQNARAIYDKGVAEYTALREAYIAADKAGNPKEALKYAGLCVEKIQYLVRNGAAKIDLRLNSLVNDWKDLVTYQKEKVVAAGLMQRIKTALSSAVSLLSGGLNVPGLVTTVKSSVGKGVEAIKAEIPRLADKPLEKSPRPLTAKQAHRESEFVKYDEEKASYFKAGNARNYDEAFDHLDNLIDIITGLIKDGNDDLTKMLIQLKETKTEFLKQYAASDPLYQKLMKEYNWYATAYTSAPDAKDALLNLRLCVDALKSLISNRTAAKINPELKAFLIKWEALEPYQLNKINAPSLSDISANVNKIIGQMQSIQQVPAYLSAKAAVPPPAKTAAPAMAQKKETQQPASVQPKGYEAEYNETLYAYGVAMGGGKLQEALKLAEKAIAMMESEFKTNPYILKTKLYEPEEKRALLIKAIGESVPKTYSERITFYNETVAAYNKAKHADYKNHDSVADVYEESLANTIVLMRTLKPEKLKNDPEREFENTLKAYEAAVKEGKTEEAIACLDKGIALTQAVFGPNSFIAGVERGLLEEKRASLIESICKAGPKTYEEHNACYKRATADYDKARKSAYYRHEKVTLTYLTAYVTSLDAMRDIQNKVKAVPASSDVLSNIDNIITHMQNILETRSGSPAVRKARRAGQS